MLCRKMKSTMRLNRRCLDFRESVNRTGHDRRPSDLEEGHCNTRPHLKVYDENADEPVKQESGYPCAGTSKGGGYGSRRIRMLRQRHDQTENHAGQRVEKVKTQRRAVLRLLRPHSRKTDLCRKRWKRHFEEQITDKSLGCRYCVSSDWPSFSAPTISKLHNTILLKI